MSSMRLDVLEMFQLRFHHNRCKTARCLPGMRGKVQFHKYYLLYAGVRRPWPYRFPSLRVSRTVGIRDIKANKNFLGYIRISQLVINP